MKPAAFDYVRPKDIAEALSLLADDTRSIKIMAGGQSLGPMLNMRLVQPDVVMDITAIAELRTVADGAASIRVGAGVTHADFEDGRVPDISRGALPFVARGIAYRAVRNRGTIGGSLTHADPSADWVSMMSAMGASVVVRSASGSRSLKVEDYMIGALTADLAAGEMLTAVEIPKLGPRARWGFYKFCRKTGEFAHAIGAFVIDPDNGLCRAVIGATESRPLVVADARHLIGDGVSKPLLQSFDAVAVEAALVASGMTDTLDIRTHVVALRRAIEQQVSR